MPGLNRRAREIYNFEDGNQVFNLMKTFSKYTLYVSQPTVIFRRKEKFIYRNILEL